MCMPIDVCSIDVLLHEESPHTYWQARTRHTQAREGAAIAAVVSLTVSSLLPTATFDSTIQTSPTSSSVSR